NGEILAENVPGYAIRMHATRPDSLEAALQRLAALVPEHQIDIPDVLAKWRAAPFLPAMVFGSGDFALLSRLEEHRAAIPGLVIQAEPRRTYPDGEAFAHLIGYVGEISREQLESGDFPGARMGEVVGRFG